MKLIKPSVEYIPQESGQIFTHEDIYRHIDKCSRICYKSEDKFHPDKSKRFIESLIKSGHLSVLEHATVYLTLNRGNKLYHELRDKYRNNPYSKVVNKGDDCYITSNFRVLQENGWLEDLTYRSFDIEYHVKRYTMKFTCARIDSQSITRYRTNSYAQESQRCINYLQEIRGASVTFSEPVWIKPEDLEELKQDAAISEQLYFKWIKKGYKPEEARYFLINGTKTEIIVTAYEDDWTYFLDQRLRNTTGKPSSDMHHLAQLLWNEFKDKLNLEL